MWMWRCAQHHKVCTMMDKEGFQGKYDFLYLPIAPRLMLLGTGIQCCPDQMLALRTSAPKPVWATPLSISSMKGRQWFFWLVALDLCAMRKAFLKSCINLMRLLLDFFSRPRNFGRLLMATQNGCCQVPRWEGFRFQFELQLGTKEILISWLRAWQQWDLAPLLHWGYLIPSLDNFVCASRAFWFAQFTTLPGKMAWILNIGRFGWFGRSAQLAGVALIKAKNPTCSGTGESGQPFWKNKLKLLPPSSLQRAMCDVRVFM